MTDLTKNEMTLEDYEVSDDILEKRDRQQPGEVTKGMLMKAWIRTWWTNEIPHSFDRYIAASLFYGLMPILRILYSNKEDLREAYQRHLVFYNSQAIWGSGTILGIVASLEQARANNLYNTGHEDGVTVDLIQNTKVGLMGPLAGIGDAIDSGTVQYIFISIALPWAQQGSAMGALFPWIGFTTVTFIYGWYFVQMGFRLGRGAAAELLAGQKAQMLINGLSILGLWMMGIIAGSYISVNAKLAFTLGTGDAAKEFILRDILDKILPGIVPLMVVMGTYFYFQKKGLKVTKALLWLTLILGVLGFARIIGV